MEYCYSGTESLWYGSWNRHVCRKGKCAADRHSRSTGVSPSRKQRCCSPSCLWSQAQRDTFDPVFLKVWVIDWQYVIDVSVCEVEPRCQSKSEISCTNQNSTFICKSVSLKFIMEVRRLYISFIMTILFSAHDGDMLVIVLNKKDVQKNKGSAF